MINSFFANQILSLTGVFIFESSIIPSQLQTWSWLLSTQPTLFMLHLKFWQGDHDNIFQTSKTFSFRAPGIECPWRFLLAGLYVDKSECLYKCMLYWPCNCHGTQHWHYAGILPPFWLSYNGFTLQGSLRFRNQPRWSLYPIWHMICGSLEIQRLTQQTEID